MNKEYRNLSSLVKDIRRQLSLSQEDLARQLAISYSPVNRWEDGVSRPSKLARAQLERFCARMTGQGRLTLSEGDHR